MNWRELITQYLAVSASDDRERLQAELADQRHKFIAQHGNQRFNDFETERLQSRAAKLESPPLSPDSCVIVCEQDELIVAEVPPGPNGHPYRLTRFRLVRIAGQWQLDDYLWKCTCTNGACNWCGGSGICAVCDGDGECKFCHNERTCQLCKGTRTCKTCRDSDMPAWNSMTKTDPRKKAT